MRGGGIIATSVGSIEATLTLDRTPFSRELRAAQAEAAAFEGHRYTAHIDADTDRAHRGLQQVDDDAKKVERSTKEASKGGNLLVNSLLALGPAVVPLAAVATTLGVGLVAAAGVGVLAILGVKNALKDATPLGFAFNAQLKILNTDLHNLETIAARGVFGGLQQGIASVHSLMPPLSKDVSVLSVQLGHIAGDIGVGLVSLFHQLNPLFVQFGDYLVTGADKFKAWAASGEGVRGFLDYAKTNLPVVLHTLGDLTVALSHIVQAAAPLGGVTLQAIDDIAQAISHIPIPILTAFIAALQVNRLLAMAGGVKGLADAFGSFQGKIGSALTSLGAFIQGTGGIAAATGYVGALVVAVGLLSTKTQSLVPQVGVNINQLSSAGEKANASFSKMADTFGGQVKDAFASGGAGAQELATKATLAAAEIPQVQSALYSTGKTANDFATAITGTNTQFDRFIESLKASKAYTTGLIGPEELDQLRKLRNEYVDGAISGRQFADAAAAVNKAMSAPNLPTFTGSLAALGKQFGLTEAQATKYAEMVGISKEAVDNGALSNKALADSIQIVQKAYNTATVTQDAFLDALGKFSTSAGTAADRAALIGATLVAGNGDALTFAASMNAGAVAADNLGKTVGHLSKGIVNLKTGEIDYNNAAAAPLIAGLQQMQTSAMGAAEGMFQHEVKTKGAKQAADDAYGAFHHLTYDALVGQAHQLGLTTDQAKKLADQYFGMPDDVKTKIEQEGGQTVEQTLLSIRDYLHQLVDPTWKPTVGPPVDKVSIPLSAIDQHLGLVGGRKPTPDVSLIDHVSVPLSAVDRHLGLTGGKRPKPTASLQDNASGPLSALDQRLGLIGGRRPTPTATLRDLASVAIRGVDGLLRSIDGRVVYSTIVTQHLDIFTVQDAFSNRGPAGVTSRASGGILKFYGTGGMDVPNGHQAEIAPAGTTRVWREPETAGEAYIPYRRDTRARSETILAQVANDFGLRVTRAVQNYATGGVSPTVTPNLNAAASDTGMWAAVLSALQALLGEIRALRANSDPWRVAQVTKMHERTR